jgi:hypothetical protein
MRKIAILYMKNNKVYDIETSEIFKLNGDSIIQITDSVQTFFLVRL